MAKTPSRPSSLASSGGDATPQRFGSGRWREASRVSGIRFKICLCGMQGVGKTSIFKRLLGEGFTDLKPTANVSTFEYKDKGDERIEVTLKSLFLCRKLYFLLYCKKQTLIDFFKRSQ